MNMYAYVLMGYEILGKSSVSISLYKYSVSLEICT